VTQKTFFWSIKLVTGMLDQYVVMANYFDFIATCMRIVKVDLPPKKTEISVFWV